jgi:hypothetical protein
MFNWRKSLVLTYLSYIHNRHNELTGDMYKDFEILINKPDPKSPNYADELEQRTFTFSIAYILYNHKNIDVINKEIIDSARETPIEGIPNPLPVDLMRPFIVFGDDYPLLIKKDDLGNNRDIDWIFYCPSDIWKKYHYKNTEVTTSIYFFGCYEFNPGGNLIPGWTSKNIDDKDEIVQFILSYAMIKDADRSPIVSNNINIRPPHNVMKKIKNNNPMFIIRHHYIDAKYTSNHNAEKYILDKTGKKLVPQMIKGSYRQQPYGKGRMNKKLIYVEPYWSSRWELENRPLIIKKYGLMN